MVDDAVVALIHELAHVVCYYLNGFEVHDSEYHGPEWQECFNKINREVAKC